MKIDNSKTLQSYTINSSLDDILLEAPIIGTNPRYISLEKQPKKIIWCWADGTAKIESSWTNSKKFEAPSGALKAYYVPSDDITLKRVVDKLGLEVPLSSNPEPDEWMNLLNLKLEKASRQLSIWDTYNIYKVAYTAEDLTSSLASLPLSSSILVNIDSAQIRIGSWTIKKGDMICRDYFGEIHHIPGANGGYYFPAEVSTSGGSISQITFQFSTQTPEPGESTSNEGSFQPHQTIKIPLTTTEGDINISCYADHGTLNSDEDHDVNFKKLEEINIEPIVYYYLENNFEEERIFLPVDYVADTTKFTIKNPTQMSLKYEVR